MAFISLFNRAWSYLCYIWYCLNAVIYSDADDRAALSSSAYVTRGNYLFLSIKMLTGDSLVIMGADASLLYLF